MKNLLILCILLSTKVVSGQNIDGIWYNVNRESFIEFHNDSCTLTNAFYHIDEGDTIKNYYPNNFNYESDSLTLIIFDEYFSSGIIFWKQCDKAFFEITQLSETSLILKSNPKNARKAHTLTDLIGLHHLDYKRVTRAEYLEIIKN